MGRELEWNYNFKEKMNHNIYNFKKFTQIFKEIVEGGGHPLNGGLYSSDAFQRAPTVLF